MDRATFRQILPEFGCAQTFSDPLLDFWFTQGRIQLDERTWGALLDQGLALYVAHNIALARQNARAGAKSVPGVASGPVSSKSIDKLSVSYDTGAAAIEGAGAWNLTTYGTRFLALVRMLGAGGLQL